MVPIISLLDNDVYKFYMMQAIWNHYPDAEVEYKFFCRDQGVQLGFLAPAVQEQISCMRGLRLTTAESNYLYSLNRFNPEFIKHITNRKLLNRAKLTVKDAGDDLDISIKGKWVDAVLWEVPLLSVITELYFREQCSSIVLNDAMDKLTKKKVKMSDYPDIKIAEFGTRRRFSSHWHHSAVSPILFKPFKGNFTGTSNILVAKNHQVPVVGTVAHEWTMAHLGLVPNIWNAQKTALYKWLQEFEGSLGIALTDTFTSDAFFKDFNEMLSYSYKGLRQDSGCPYTFTEKAIQHYIDMGIDPRTKTIVYSDGLDMDSCIELWKAYNRRIGVTFGVGTNLTNDIPGSTPLNIVIKMTSINGKPTVKLSDDKGKEMGPEKAIREIKACYGQLVEENITIDKSEPQPFPRWFKDPEYAQLRRYDSEYAGYYWNINEPDITEKLPECCLSLSECCRSHNLTEITEYEAYESLNKVTFGIGE